MQEIKIVLSKYKVLLISVFLIVFAIIFPVESNCDIGTLIDAHVISLVAILCGCNIMYQELYGDLKDVFGKMGYRKNFRTLLRRILIQWIGLLVLSVGFYWMFFLRNLSIENSILIEFLQALFAIAVSIFFFTVLSVFTTCLFKNQWAGMGISFVIYQFFNSTGAEKLLKPQWNIRAYSLDSENMTDVQWMTGKYVFFLIACILLLIVRGIMAVSREGVVIKEKHKKW